MAGRAAYCGRTKAFQLEKLAAQVAREKGVEIAPLPFSLSLERLAFPMMMCPSVWAKKLVIVVTIEGAADLSW